MTYELPKVTSSVWATLWVVWVVYYLSTRRLYPKMQSLCMWFQIGYTELERFTLILPYFFGMTFTTFPIWNHIHKQKENGEHNVTNLKSSPQILLSRVQPPCEQTIYHPYNSEYNPHMGGNLWEFTSHDQHSPPYDQHRHVADSHECVEITWFALALLVLDDPCNPFFVGVLSQIKPTQLRMRVFQWVSHKQRYQILNLHCAIQKIVTVSNFVSNHLDECPD